MNTDMEFPTNEELNAKVTKSSIYLKWKDVPKDIWYKIILKREIETKNGKALILTLRDRAVNEFTTFTTSLIQKEIENNPETEFIKSNGKPDGKKYYGFDIIC